MTTQIMVRGKLVTNALVTAFARRLNSTDEVVTQWANAAVLELVKNKNSNWFTELFACKALRLENGQLNKLGQEVYSYVQAHFPRAVYDKETQVVGLKKFNPDSPLADNFIAVSHTAENVELNIVEINGKFYAPQGDFMLTFAEYKAFKAQSAPKDENDDIKPVQAKAFAKAALKALEAQKVSKFIGSPDELVAAMEAIGLLADGIRAQIAGADQAAINAALDILAAANIQAGNNAALINPESPTSLQLSDDEKALIEANRAALAKATESNKQADLKRDLLAKQAAPVKAAQAVAATALDVEMAQSHAAANAKPVKAKKVA